MRSARFILLPILFSGCVTDQPPAPQVDTNELKAKLSAALDRATAAEKARDELEKSRDANDTAEKERAGRTKAVLDETNIDLGSSLVDLAVLNVKLALTWYEQVQANPDLKVWLANQRAAHEAGRADEVARNYDVAMADGKALSGRIGALSEQLEQAKATESKARTDELEARKALANEVEKHANEIEDAKRIERDKIAADTKAWQVKFVLWIGGILLIATIALSACCFLLPVAISIFKKSAFVAGIGCAACFALARFMSSPWFDYAWKITAGTLIVAGISWAAWELRQAIKRSHTENVAADNDMVANKIIPVLDNYYKHVASPEAIKDMDKKGGLWDLLDDLGGAYDAAVKRIKAKQAENTSAEIKASIKLAESLDKKD